MGWHFVPGLVASSSDSTSPSASSTAPWCTSSGMPTRRLPSWRGWKTRPWIQRLWPTILNPSTAARGAVAWISSLPVSLASPSAAGKRLGVDDERWLWPDIARIVEEVAPAMCFFENVPGLLTVNAGAGFHELLDDLAALGFDCVWDVFSAAEVGAPHLRERLFILAIAPGRGRRV